MNAFDIEDISNYAKILFQFKEFNFKDYDFTDYNSFQDSIPNLIITAKIIFYYLDNKDLIELLNQKYNWSRIVGIDLEDLDFDNLPPHPEIFYIKHLVEVQGVWNFRRII